jgi:M6 family metalloprotease-like protein
MSSTSTRRWPLSQAGRVGPAPRRLLLGLVALASLPASRLVAQTTSATGWITPVFTEDESQGRPLRFFFTTDAGRRLELLPDPSAAAVIGADPVRRGFRARVEIESRPAMIRQAPAGSTPLHRALQIARLSPPAARTQAGVVASRPYVTILCRFADVPTEPFQPTEVQVRMGNSYPGADHYFQELSEGQVTLAGSVTVGWYVLPKPRSGYVSGTSLDVAGLTTDCTAAADADVDFTQFTGVILQFNAGLSVRAVAPFDTLSFGGFEYLTNDGANRSFPMVWMSREHVYNYVVLHHELGHSFGWPHSSGPYAQTYDSNWDIMSRGYIYQDPVYGWLGPHTVAYHKDLSGWIPSGRLWRPGVGDPSSFLLDRTALPPPGSGYQAAILPIPGAARFYTVEARMNAGYDRGFPGTGVVIHEVDPARWDRTAEVVDPDNNGDPNDAAAIWVPGESFSDLSNGYVVTVDSVAPDGFWVTIGDASFALSATSRSGSALVGTSTAHPDSAALQVIGSNAATDTWNVSHRAAATWLRILTPSGAGSATLRWERDPTGLAEGVYLDTLTVSLPGYATGTPFLVDSFLVQGPLGVAVVPGGVRDSFPSGTTAVRGAVAALVMTGFGGDTAHWTMTHGSAPWITLVTPAGLGSSQLSWNRDPAGLAPGTYVDTLQVSVPGASGSPFSIVDSAFVTEPGFTTACAADGLLSNSGCLGTVERNYLDLSGNHDGAYNLGDLLAYLDRKGLPLPPSLVRGPASTGGSGVRQGHARASEPGRRP